MEGKYLEAFKELFEQGSNFYQLIGDCLIVEELPQKEEEKSTGGIILPMTKGQNAIAQGRPLFVQVLAVGEGYYDDTNMEKSSCSECHGTGRSVDKATFGSVCRECGGTKYTQTMDFIPLTSKVGDIVLVGDLSVKWLSTFGPIVTTKGSRVGLVREGEVQLRFKGQNGYNEVFRILGDALKYRTDSEVSGSSS